MYIRAIALSPAWGLAAAMLTECLSFMLKFFYVMGKALSGKLSCIQRQVLFNLEFLKAAAAEHWHLHAVLLFILLAFKVHAQ